VGLINRRGTPKLVIANWRDRRHPQAGGAEVVCEQLAKHFAAEGHDVRLQAARVEAILERAILQQAPRGLQA